MELHCCLAHYLHSDTNAFRVFSGIVNMSFPLSDQPVFGEWIVFVEVQGHTYNKSFEVQKYGEAALHLQDSLKAPFIKSSVTFFFKESLSFSLLFCLHLKYLPHVSLRDVPFLPYFVISDMNRSK